MKAGGSLAWIGAVALVALVAGCGGNGQSPVGPTVSAPGIETAGVGVVAASSVGQTRHLPVSDFIERQGNVIFHWWEPATDRWLSFDHYGVRGAALGLGLPTTVEGDVAIRALVDGRAQVTVTLHTRNALCFGWQGEDLAFGYSGGEVRNGVGPAALGDGLYREVFTMPSPESPLPSLEDWSSGDYVDRRYSIVISCKGLLRAPSGFPEGTPGYAHTTQQGLLDAGAPGHCPAGDCWPVEKVFFRPIGH